MLSIGDSTSVIEPLSHRIKIEPALEGAEVESVKAQGQRDSDRAHGKTLPAEAATARTLRTTVEAFRAARDAENARMKEIRQDRDRLVALAVSSGPWSSQPWWWAGRRP